MNAFIAGCILVASIACAGCSSLDLKTQITTDEDTKKAIAEFGKDIDLLGHKELLKRIDLLQGQLNVAMKKLADLGQAGVIDLGPNERAVFEITRFRGDLTINAWLDQPDSQDYKFIASKVINDGDQLPGFDEHIAKNLIGETAEAMFVAATGHRFDDYNWITTCNSQTAAQVDYRLVNAAIQGYTTRLNTLRQEIDERYTDQCKKSLLSRPEVPAGVSTAFIDKLVQTSGVHRIFLSVTPKAAQGHDKWFVEWQLTILRSTGTREAILQGGIYSDRSDFKWEWNKPSSAQHLGTFYARLKSQ